MRHVRCIPHGTKVPRTGRIDMRARPTRQPLLQKSLTVRWAVRAPRSGSWGGRCARKRLIKIAGRLRHGGPSPCLKTRLRLVSPRFLSPPGRETLPPAIVSDHDWILDRGGGRMDYQEPGVIPAGRRLVVPSGRTLNCCVDRLPTVMTPIGDPSRSSGTPKKVGSLRIRPPSQDGAAIPQNKSAAARSRGGKGVTHP